MSKGSIRARGKSSWEIKFDISPNPETGKRRTKTKNVKGTKRDAQRELNKVLVDVAEQSFISPSKETVGQLAKHWLEQVAPHKNSALSIEVHENRISAHITPYLGNVELGDISADHIERLYSTLRKTGNRRTGGPLAEQTIIHVQSSLSLILGWAYRKDKIKSNPLDKVENRPSKSISNNSAEFDEEEDEVKVYKDEELKSLLSKLTGNTLYYPVLTAAMTGLRRGEILGLKWEDIDLTAKTLKVKRSVGDTRKLGIQIKPPKSKSSRREISLPDTLVDALQAHKKEQAELFLKLGKGQSSDDFTFANWEGNIQSPGAFTNKFRRVTKGMGLSHCNFHMLRHTHASALLKELIPITTVSKRLGHRDASITLKVYSHVMEGMDQDAAASADQIMNKILGATQ
jgi:integrase